MGKFFHTYKGGILMKRNMKMARWTSLLMGILLVILGVIFYRNPIKMLISFSDVIAIMLIGIGILRVIRYFTDDIFKSGAFLMVSIMDIILGSLMILTQPLTAITLTYILGFWIIVTGVSEMAIAIHLKHLKVKGWWGSLISAIIGIIVGIMILTDPLLATIYISTYVILYGFTFIITFFTLSSKINK